MLFWYVIYLIIFAYLVRVCFGVLSPLLNQQQIRILFIRFTHSPVPILKFYSRKSDNVTIVIVLCLSPVVDNCTDMCPTREF